MTLFLEAVPVITLENTKLGKTNASELGISLIVVLETIEDNDSVGFTHEARKRTVLNIRIFFIHLL
jgi:hypothetical protein